jgi:hypothetical protein
MECPPGMKEGTKDKVLLLHQCIYGLVQAARQYYKHIVKILKRLVSKVDVWIRAYFQKRANWVFALLSFM